MLDSAVVLAYLGDVLECLVVRVYENWRTKGDGGVV